MLDRLDLAAHVGADLGDAEQAEGSVAHRVEVIASVGEALGFDDLGHRADLEGRRGAAHLAALLDEHHAEPRALLQALADHQLVPLLEDTERQGLGGKEDHAQGE